MFDLLLRGGTLIDPAQGRHGTFDLAVADGRVAEVAPTIAPEQAREVIDATGKLVLPGLIDLHCHVFWGVGPGADPELHCLARGSTTLVDGGSAGGLTFAGFRRYVIERTAPNVLAWLHLSSTGLIELRWSDIPSPVHADVGLAAATIAANQDRIVGVKLRTSDYVLGMAALPFVRLAIQAAERHDLPVMLHIGASAEPLPKILEILRPGDVITHMFTGRRHGLLDLDGQVLPQVREARERGVIFDCAIGRGHLRWPVARALIDQEFLPDTLATDITNVRAEADRHFHLPAVMSYCLAMGMPLERVIEAVTSRPAQVLGRPELGTLAPGGEADVTVLEEQEGEFTWVDTFGGTYTANRRLEPWLTLRRGVKWEMGDGG